MSATTALTRLLRSFSAPQVDYSALHAEVLSLIARDQDLDRLTNRLAELLRSALQLDRVAIVVLNNHSVARVVQRGFATPVPFGTADLSLLLSPSSDLATFCQTHDLSQVVTLKLVDNPVGYLLFGRSSLSRTPFSLPQDLIEFFALVLQYVVTLRAVVEFNQTLEGKVAERTKELQEAQAKEVKLKDEFVFIATHDLSTPVTAINGFITLIQGSGVTLPPPLPEQIGAISAASERLKQLVNDLLQVARSDSGTIRVSLTELDAAPILQAAVTQAQTLAAQQSVTLSLKLASDNRVASDPAKLAEIFENLISNGIKYNKPGGSLTITSVRTEGTLNFLFADTGVGITPLETPKIFTKFFRSERGDVRARPGTGLGLFVVRMLTEKLGGKISFNSTAGTGTTFILQLPI